MKRQLMRILALMLVGGLVMALAGFVIGGNTYVYLSKGARGFEITRPRRMAFHEDEPLEFSKIVIDASIADVRVSEGDAFSIHAVSTNGNEPMYTLEDGELSVHNRNPDADFFLNVGFMPNNDNYIDICLPKGMHYESMQVLSGTGYVAIEYLSIGSLDVSCFTGGVILSEIKADSMRIDQSTGDIWIRGIEAKDAMVKSRTGDIRLDFVQADMFSLANSTGRIDGSDIAVKSAVIENSTGEVHMDSWSSDALTATTRTGTMVFNGTLRGMTDLRSSTGNIFIDTSLTRASYETEFSTRTGEVPNIPKTGEVPNIPNDDPEEAASATNKLSAHTNTGWISVSFQDWEQEWDSW